MKEGTRIQLEKRTKLENVIPLDTPFVLYVDPSSFCNLKCFYCYHSQKQKNIKFGLMFLDTFKEILKQSLEFPSPIKVLRLYGFGEPLLNPNFTQFVNLAKQTSKFETIDVTTNGIFLNFKLIDELVDLGLDRINISLMGVGFKDYKKITQKYVDFENLVENIKYFYNKKNRKCKIFVKINADILENQQDLEKFKKIFAPISDELGIEHLMSCWDEVEGFEANKQVGIYGQFLQNINVCPYIFYSLMVQYDGKVSACFLDWNRKLILGDIKTQLLKDIWEGEKLFNIQKLMLEGNRKKIIPCNKCSQLTHGMCDNIDGYASSLITKVTTKFLKKENK